MSALTGARNTPLLGANGSPVIMSYPVKGSTHIYSGSMVCIGSDGYAIPASAATGHIPVGIAQADANNTSVTDGAISCSVVQAVGRFGNGATLTLNDVGKKAYALDDQTITDDSTTNSAMGIIQLVDANGVWVYIGLPMLGAA